MVCLLDMSSEGGLYQHRCRIFLLRFWWTLHWWFCWILHWWTFLLWRGSCDDFTRGRAWRAWKDAFDTIVCVKSFRARSADYAPSVNSDCVARAWNALERTVQSSVGPWTARHASILGLPECSFRTRCTGISSTESPRQTIKLNWSAWSW